MIQPGPPRCLAQFLHSNPLHLYRLLQQYCCLVQACWVCSVSTTEKEQIKDGALAPSFYSCNKRRVIRLQLSVKKLTDALSSHLPVTRLKIVAAEGITHYSVKRMQPGNNPAGSQQIYFSHERTECLEDPTQFHCDRLKSSRLFLKRIQTVL